MKLFAKILTALSLLTISTQAQDSLFFKEHPYNFSFKLYSNYLNQRLNLYSKSVTKAKNAFVPNIKGTIGVSLNLKYTSLSYSQKLNAGILDEEKYGATKYFTFSSESYHKKFGLELSYQQYKGFYRPGNVLTFRPLQARPDIRFYHANVSLLFFGNSKKFNFAAAFSQSKKQLKSAGGLVVTSAFNFKNLIADSSLISKEIDTKDYFGNYTGVKNFAYIPLELRFGYAYNFVIKRNWFVCPYLSAGSGVTIYRYKNKSESNIIPAIYTIMQFRLAAGYSYGRYFVSSQVNLLRNKNYLREKVYLSHDSYLIAANIGVRFFSKRKKDKDLKNSNKTFNSPS